MNKDIFQILYLSECPEKYLNNLPKEACVKKWERNKEITEREDLLNKKETLDKLFKSCRCFMEYEKSRGIEVFTAEGGYVNYINKKRYHCRIMVENDASLFNILKKYFKKNKLLVDSKTR